MSWLRFPGTSTTANDAFLAGAEVNRRIALVANGLAASRQASDHKAEGSGFVDHPQEAIAERAQRAKGKDNGDRRRAGGDHQPPLPYPQLGFLGRVVPSYFLNVENRVRPQEQAFATGQG